MTRPAWRPCAPRLAARPTRGARGTWPKSWQPWPPAKGAVPGHDDADRRLLALYHDFRRHWRLSRLGQGAAGPVQCAAGHRDRYGAADVRGVGQGGDDDPAGRYAVLAPNQPDPGFGLLWVSDAQHPGLFSRQVRPGEAAGLSAGRGNWADQRVL